MEFMHLLTHTHTHTRGFYPCLRCQQRCVFCISLLRMSDQLKTDDKGVAHWSTCPFTVADKGVCTAPLNDAVVS